MESGAVGTSEQAEQAAVETGSVFGWRKRCELAGRGEGKTAEKVEGGEKETEAVKRDYE